MHRTRAIDASRHVELTLRSTVNHPLHVWNNSSVKLPQLHAHQVTGFKISTHVCNHLMFAIIVPQTHHPCFAVQVEVRASGRRKAPAAEKDSALANLAAERERRSGKGSGKGDKATQGDGPSQKARGSNGRQGKGDRSDEDAEMSERGRGKGKRGAGKGADSGDDDASDGDDGEVRVL